MKSPSDDAGWTRWSFPIVAALLLVGATLACNLGRRIPSATPSPEKATPRVFLPTPTPTSPGPTPTPLPPTNPIVVEYTPDRGEEGRLDGPITLYFDQPMDRVSVEKAIRIQPAVEGKLVWLDDRTVQFKPTSRLKRAQRYRVSVGQEARSKAGLPLARPVQFTFQTVGYLEVSQVIPAPGTQDVATDSVITVFFNRPVVPLVGVEEQANLPQPLEIDPPVSGHGEWINTSIYTFYPDRLAPGQTYQVRVPAGLEDTTGGELADDYTWTFTTEQPRVLGTYPADGAYNVSLTTVISVTFNQPMDRASTEAAFRLFATDGIPIPGSFRWNEDGTEMGFVPSSLLPLGEFLSAEVGQEARAAGAGATLAEPYTWGFMTVPPPRIIGTDPEDGDQNVGPGQGFTIYFDAPIRPETVMRHVTILPAPTEVYTYWNRYDTSFYIGFDALPSTDYEVRIAPGIADPYGNTTEQELVIRYRTRALSSQAYLRVPGQVGVYSAYAESTDLFAVYRNVSRLDFSLYRLTLAQFQRLTGPRSWDAWEKFRPEESAELVRQWSVEPEAALNETAFHRARLAGPEGGPLPPGFYFLELSTPETRRSRSYYGQRRHLIVVADAQLTLKMSRREVLVWATDLQTGQPIAGLPITFYDAGMRSLAQGQTDAEGVFRARFDEALNLWGAYYAVAKPEGHLAVAFSQWSDGIAPWDFNMRSEFDPAPFSLYLYTDRPIYRPGQTVYFKGIVRQDDDARYSLPPLRELPVTIRDDEGKVVYSDTLSLSAMGTFHGEFVLDEEATLGYYYLYARVPEGVAGLKRPFERGVGFRVAEYRRPEFQVSVTPDKDAYLHGETIQVVVQARYFFGGPVANAPVQWTLTSDNYFFRWSGPGRYDWTDSDEYRPWWWGGFEGFGEVIASGEGVTDEEGRFIFEVPADIADQATSQRFTLEATVTDVNDRTVSNQATVIVHKGRFYIGLRPERYVGKVNEPQTVDVRTVDWEGEPYPGADLTVTFYHREWFSVQEEDPHGRLYWTWTFSDTAVSTATLTTDREGRGTVSFVPPKGGSYIVRAVGQDEAGNTVRSSTFLWVSSSTYIAWRQENNDRIELVTDKTSYRPGETAEILIPSPYQGAVQALFTVERGHILEYQVLTLESNSQVLRLPIRPEHAPNVYVSVVLVKGVDETNPVPSFKVGYATFTVSPEQQELTITLTPDREVYGPRERATFTIQATDYRGQAVTAEISLALVDLSVLTLADPNAPPITDHFYGERGLGVRTATGLTLSGDRVTEQVITEVKGGGGGGQAGAGFIRRRFPDTAYWAPAVLTDDEGRAQVQVDLPDSLTTWRLLAKGVTAETLVGEAQVEIVTTKELLIRPITPRFFVVGDRAQVGAIVHNNTDRDLTVDVALTATGVDLESPATQTVEVPAHGKARVDWTVTVPSRPGEEQFADLTFSARGGGLSDASKPTLGIPPDQVLPIYKYTAPETVGTAGTIEEAEARLELIALPRRIEVTQGELTLRLDPSLAAGMTEGLRYLEHYPYECTEQTVSRFLPNVLTYQALKELGLVRPDLEAKLQTLVRVGLQRLYSQQHADGGWGWWSRDQSDPVTTAYALLGMAKARDAGFSVDTFAIFRAVRFLREQLQPPKALTKEYQLNRQAFLLYVLAEVGRVQGEPAGDLGRTVALYEVRDRLDHYGKALLALALHLQDPEGQAERVQTLLADLNNAAIVEATGAHWEEADRDWWNWNTDTRSTAIILDALARLDPENGLAPNVVRWLMVARQDGHWETTQETAWALIALTDWMAATGELQADYAWGVQLNGRVLETGTFDRETVLDEKVLQVAVADLFRDEANRLVIEKGPGPGRLYYTAHLRAFLPVEEVQPLDRGIIVRRQYCRPPEPGRQETGKCELVTTARVGDLLQVQLTLIAPRDLYYVVVEDPLPAGAEAVDTSLKTSSVVGQAPELRRVDPRDPFAGYGGWGWWWFSQTELRDEKVVLFATRLPKGTYQYTYQIQLGLAGEYRVIPPTAYEMYFPEVFGRGAGMVFTIER